MYLVGVTRTDAIQVPDTLPVPPVGQPLETPLHQRTPRVYQFEDVRQKTDAMVVDTSPVPSPAAFEVCGSGLSTPSSVITPVAVDSKLPTSSTVSALRAVRRCLLPQPAAARVQSTSHVPSRGLTDDQIDTLVNYGSEEDDSEGDEDEAFVSRDHLREYFMDEENINPELDIYPRAQTSEHAQPNNSSVASESATFTETAEPAASVETDCAACINHVPSDLFDFSWKTFSPSSANLYERKESFRGDHEGPTATYKSPYETFVAIWTPEFMDFIATETNRYAQQNAAQKFVEGILMPRSRITQWKDTCRDELYVYFAIMMSMGLCVRSEQSEYWVKNDLFSLPNFCVHMSYNRFCLISSNLHFINNLTDITELTMTKTEARLSKIAPVVRHLNNKFQELYHLSQNIALDESLTQWKGWLNFKQFIKNKAAGVGIKTYEVCESRTGYLWRFKVYGGTKDELTIPPLSPLDSYTGNLVLELLRGLENKGHCVWMDNFYNSPALSRVLKSRGFDCVGTLRLNRQFVPDEIQTLEKKDMIVGQVTACTSGDVDIVVWRDNNRVSMTSTYHGAAVHTVAGKTKPIVVHDYNVCMGGVDKKDQMLSMFPVERKRTKVWYKKFFKRLLNVSILNSFILYRTTHSISHRDFRKELINQLLATHHQTSVRPGPPALPVTLPHGKVTFDEEVLAHFPFMFGMEVSSGKNRRIRRTCVVCHKRNFYECKACKVALCVGDCFVQYHRK